MFSWVASEALSVRKVADRLTALRVPTRSGNPVWSIASAYKMLRNETYAGVWSFYKHESVEPTEPRRKSRYRHKSKTSRKPNPRSKWVPISLPERLHIIDRTL